MKKTACVIGAATLASLAVPSLANAAGDSAITPAPSPTGSASSAQPTAAAPAQTAPTAAPTTAQPTTGAAPAAPRTASAAATAASTPATADPSSSATADATPSSAPISAAAAAANLGAPTSAVVTLGTGTAQNFAGGVVYWSPATGAHALTGAFALRYPIGSALFANLGFPTTDQFAGANGTTVVNCQGGQLVSSADGVRAVYGQIGTTYAGLGSTSSPLGAPRTDEQDGQVPGSRVNRFVGGTIDWSPATGAAAVYGNIGTTYANLGYEGSDLGLPLNSEKNGAVAGSRKNDFQGGQIIWTGATGAQAVYGQINNTYTGMGAETSVLGLPLSSERNGAVAGSRKNDFQGGQVLWTGATGARAVYGQINNTYTGMGAETSVLGLPTSSERDGALAGERKNDFQGGQIIWSGATGARAVYGQINNTYNGMGGETSALGLPTSSEKDGAVAGSRKNDFVGGTILWSPSTGANAVYGAIGAKYAELGGEGGFLGLPTSSEFWGANGARVNRFQNGLIIWTPATGAHVVRGAILTEFGNRGYEGGSLGAPTSDEYTIPGGWEQKFQKGTLTLVNGVFQDTVAPAPAPAQQAPLKSSINAYGNYYYAGSCAWYAYNRRVELGAPVSTLWGNGGEWAANARTEGYRVDHTVQVGAVISTYGYGAGYLGHVMVVEEIYADGSFRVSQMNAPTAWVVSYRTFTAADAANLWFIH